MRQMEPDPLDVRSVDEILEQVYVERPDTEDKTGPQLPAQMKLLYRGPDIEIVRKWFAPQAVVLVVLAVGYWGGLLFVLTQSEKLFEDGELFPGYVASNPLLAILLAAIGIGLPYYAIAHCLNRTHLVVSRGKMAVRHGPIPWRGNKEIEVSNVKQLYTEEKETHYKGGTIVTYEVHVLTPDDRRVKLVDGLKTSEQARFIEQQIEKYLGIENEYVESEY